MVLFRYLCRRIFKPTGHKQSRLPIRALRGFRPLGYSGGQTFLCAGLLSYLKSALNIEEIDSPNDKLVETIKLGILNMQRDELEKAEMILHAALRMAMELSHSDGVLYIHDLLADLAFQKGEYYKAERLFTDVLQRLLGPPKNTPLSANSVVEVSLKLTQIYAQAGEDGKAEEGFGFCLRTMDKKVKNLKGGEEEAEEEEENTRALWGMVHDKYGEYLLSKGRPVSALPHFESAHQAAVLILGESHSQSLIILNSLGTCQSLQGNYSAASASFAKAVDLDKNSDFVQRYLVNLGMSFIQRELLNDAKKACSSGLEISRKRKDIETEAEANECLKLAAGAI